MVAQSPELTTLLTIVAISLTFSMLTELLMWFLIYRHEEYKKAVEEIVVLQERVENM